MVQRSLLPLQVDYRSPQKPGCRLLIASVVFGQNTLGCRGNGICRVDMVTSTWKDLEKMEEESIQEEACIKNPVEISCTAQKRMRFTLYEELLHSKVKARFFANNYFDVKERFEIPNTLVVALDLKIKWVQVGIYDIKRIKNTLIIDF